MLLYFSNVLGTLLMPFIKVYAEATIAFPMIVAATFARPSGPEPSTGPEKNDGNKKVTPASPTS